MRKKVVVLGSNFGGLTASLAVKHELEGDVDVTVISPSDHFLFNPSLIWLPFGKREREDITFPVAPTFETHDVDFVNEAATGIDLEARKVTYGNGTTIDYDYLVIATGYHNKDDVVPGLQGERGHHHHDRGGRARERGVETLPGGAGRHRHRGDAERRVLRRGLRVPLQHRLPPEEERPA